MEDYNGYETVKECLILAGISELQKHSIEDLSLRRVSALCNVSCAAPYKHFKNKQEFVFEIMLYINRQWEKLRCQVMEAFADNEKTQLIEVCIAYIRFCIANPNFRNIMSMKPDSFQNSNMQDDFYFTENENLIRDYCIKKFKSEGTVKKKIFTIHSIIYGTAYMMDRKYLENSKETISMVRLILEEELE